jgi:hypothetical protein
MQMLAARVRVTRDDATVQAPVRVANLSGDGAYLVCPRRLSPGDRLELFLPPGELAQPLHIPARVAWVAPASRRFWRAGIQFTGLTAAGRNAILERALLEQVYSAEVLEALLRDVQRVDTRP